MLLPVFFPLVGHFWITAATEEMLAVTALENVNVSLKCTAQMKPGVDYRAVHWYKEGVAPRLTGLVCTALPNGKLKWYVGADPRVSLEYSTLSLLLPPVTCGVYQCFMVAPVGEQNLEGRVRLLVRGCPTVTDPPVIPERKEYRIAKLTSLLDSESFVAVIIGAMPLIIVALVWLICVVCRSDQRKPMPSIEIYYPPTAPINQKSMTTCEEIKTGDRAAIPEISERITLERIFMVPRKSV